MAEPCPGGGRRRGLPTGSGSEALAVSHSRSSSGHTNADKLKGRCRSCRHGSAAAVGAGPPSTARLPAPRPAGCCPHSPFAGPKPQYGSKMPSQDTPWGSGALSPALSPRLGRRSLPAHGLSESCSDRSRFPQGVLGAHSSPPGEPARVGPGAQSHLAAPSGQTSHAAITAAPADGHCRPHHRVTKSAP